MIRARLPGASFNIQPVQVAEIDDAPRVRRIFEQGCAHVEVELLGLPGEQAGGATDGGRREGGVAWLRRIVGGRLRNAEDGDGRPVQIVRAREGSPAKGLNFVFFDMQVLHRGGRHVPRTRGFR